MAKVITTLAAENGMGFEDICSFETKSYIGIWDCASYDFALIPKTRYEFRIRFLGYKEGRYVNLQEFDDEIFKICGEHILEVFEENKYAITLIKE